MSSDAHAVQTVERLLGILDLDESRARTTEDIFTGSSHPMPSGRIYGGQVLAQSLIAAERTLPEDRTVHSMHGYFLRPRRCLPRAHHRDRPHPRRALLLHPARAGLSERRTDLLDDRLVPG